MDIDILQVQETVTIDRNGSLLFAGGDGKDDANADLTSDLLQVSTEFGQNTKLLVTFVSYLWNYDISESSRNVLEFFRNF